MAQILDGKKLAQKLNSKLKTELDKLVKIGKTKPTLVVVLVGNDPASETYVRNKARACKSVGINSELYLLQSTVSESNLLSLIDKLNGSSYVTGILVQLPLPEHIDSKKVFDRISPHKDVDGFSTINIGKLYGKNKENGLFPCTPVGVMEILKSTKVNLNGKHAVIVGRSHIVGRPLAELLLQSNATVTVCHSYSKNLQKYTKEGDIVIAAVGSPNLVKGSWLKKGAIAVDVGLSRLGNKGLVGDIEFESASRRCSFITPVPGGVGPMTIAMLMANTLRAFKIQKGMNR